MCVLTNERPAVMSLTTNERSGYSEYVRTPLADHFLRPGCVGAMWFVLGPASVDVEKQEREES